MNYMGCTTALLSLILRFTKEEFQYYLFIDEFAPNYLRKVPVSAPASEVSG